MGGGGGSGEGNNGLAIGGRVGGGIILIKAEEITTSCVGGINISANGESVLNGSIAYSQTRSVKIDRIISSSNIYPNPATNQLTVEGQNLSINNITIYNTLGQNMMSNYSYIEVESSKIIVNLSLFPAGVYYIVVNAEVIRFSKL